MQHIIEYMMRWGNVHKDYKTAFTIFSIFKICAHGMCTQRSLNDIKQ